MLAEGGYNPLRLRQRALILIGKIPDQALDSHRCPPIAQSLEPTWFKVGTLMPMQATCALAPARMHGRDVKAPAQPETAGTWLHSHSRSALTRSLPRT